jgi:enediyne biosynthesis protein E8
MAEHRSPHWQRRMTLEAFADTIVPGEKRSAQDRAVAGVVTGGGAVAGGAVPLLEAPEGGLAPMLGQIAAGLNGHAMAYARERGLTLSDAAPPFVALPFPHRTALVRELTAPEHPEREIWTGVAIFSYMAFDSAAHLHTVDAVTARHPGLAMLRFAHPDADGLWRFPDHSYGRSVAPLHPNTTPSGSPA